MGRNMQVNAKEKKIIRIRRKIEIQLLGNLALIINFYYLEHKTQITD